MIWCFVNANYSQPFPFKTVRGEQVLFVPFWRKSRSTEKFLKRKIRSMKFSRRKFAAKP